MTQGDPIRILVCDDSATYAKALAGFLSANGDIEVVGICATGEETLRALPRLAPDLVTIDLELSGMGGIRAIAQIMESHPIPILALSAAIRRGSGEAEEALAAGALEALPKTQVRLGDPEGPAAVALRHRLTRLARRPAAAAPPEPSRGVPLPRAPPWWPCAPRPAGHARSRPSSGNCPLTSRSPSSSPSTWVQGSWTGSSAGSTGGFPFPSAWLSTDNRRAGHLVSPGRRAPPAGRLVEPGSRS